MAQRYTGRKRAYSAFTAQVEDWVEESEARMIAVMRQSLQDVINEAQQPVAKGGRMRVDTGFLRASGQASLTGMPTGPARGERKEKGAYDNGEAPPHPSVVLLLGKGDNGLKVGSTFFFGWTAEYAKYRELYDGFLEGALRHWPRIVAFNTDSLKQRINK